MSKKRRSVLFSDSNSDEDFTEKPKKSKIKRSKTIEKPIVIDSDDEEIVEKKQKVKKISKPEEKRSKTTTSKTSEKTIKNKRESSKSPLKSSPPTTTASISSSSGIRQLKLEEAFKRQQQPSASQKASTSQGQKNTLDKYFMKSPATSTKIPAKENKVEISVEDYFGSPKATSSSTTISLAKVTTETLPTNGLTISSTSPSKALKEKQSSTISPSGENSIETKSSSTATTKTTTGTEAVSKYFQDPPTKSITKRNENSLEKSTSSTPIANRSATTGKSLLTPTISSSLKRSPERSSLMSPASPSDPSTTAHDTPPPMKKRVSNFLAFKNREGPQSLGSRAVPMGSDTCLKGITIVVTGVLESVDRDELKIQIEKMGGKVTGSVSKRTNYLVIGRDPGESKMSKADQLNVPHMDEDNLFKFLEEKTGKSSNPSDVVPLEFPVPAADNVSASISDSSKVNQPPPPPSSSSVPKSSPSIAIRPTAKPTTSISTKPVTSSLQTKKDDNQLVKVDNQIIGKQDLWVDKYRPKAMNQLVGQFGPKSCANKLQTWLKEWHSKFQQGQKEKAYNPASGWNAGSDEGHWSRAALLSGPPGIGKTTTVEVVCQALGFTAVELNASDQRNKRSLKEGVAQSLNTHSLKEMLLTYSSAASSTTTSLGKRHCLVMDEVDGMAGNEDRGGVQELIQLIKTTRIPIICMCNDRQSPKIRSLANYCFDLRFQRPRVEQIKSLLLTISSREKINVPTDALNDIIQASNQDIRQVINNLQVWNATTMEVTQMKRDAISAQKDLHFSPFETVRKVFSPDPNATIHDKLDLFFQDYNFGPLFVQENYIHVRPLAAKNDIYKTLDLLSSAASSIAVGDLVSKKIRTTNNWSLLPTQAIFSSFLPGEYLHGHLSNQISFPSWLGKNSSQNKSIRLSCQLCTHLRLSTHGGCQPQSLIMDYAPVLASKLTKPLREGDFLSVLACLENYNLLKEDMDAIIELTQWSNMPDRMAGVDSKVKAALTRAYNKSAHLLPYVPNGGAAVTGRGKGKGNGGGGGEEEGGLDEFDAEGDVEGTAGDDAEEDEESVSTEELLKRDAMIVVKKGKKPSESQPPAEKATAAAAGKKKAPAKKPAAPRKPKVEKKGKK